MAKISVVINTLNEEKNLPRVLSSVADFADEIIVCDMYSADKTMEIAKKAGAKVYSHQKTNYVEPARNYAIGKATGDWILILDADEEISPALKEELKRIVKSGQSDVVLIPRKNIIFGKWIRHSRWWPDYLVRFFRKGKVKWGSRIHSVPEIEGSKIELPAQDAQAIIHHHYSSISQYLERLNRYSEIQAGALISEGYCFSWRDLLMKPLNEFLGRFFAGEGYKDGIHGLVLAFLQTVAEFIVYAKVWEKEGFKEEDIPEAIAEIEKGAGDLRFWLNTHEKNPLKKILRKIVR